MKNLLNLFAAIAFVATMASPAAAIDFSSKIVQLDGTAFAGTDGKPVDLTLGKVVIESLLAGHADEQTLPGPEKMRRFVLAQKIHGKAEVELSAEEIALIKLLVAKSYNPLVMGQAWRALDPSSAK